MSSWLQSTFCKPARSRNFVISTASVLVLERKQTQHIDVEPLLHTKNCVRAPGDFKVYMKSLFSDSMYKIVVGTLRQLRKMPKCKVKYVL